MEVTEVPEYRRKLVMILHLPPFMDLTPKQRAREDRFFEEMARKGYHTRPMNGLSDDTLGLYTIA